MYSSLFAVFAVMFLVGIVMRWKERHTTHGKRIVALAIVAFVFCSFAAVNYALNPIM